MKKSRKYKKQVLAGGGFEKIIRKKKSKYLQKRSVVKTGIVIPE